MCQSTGKPYLVITIVSVRLICLIVGLVTLLSPRTWLPHGFFSSQTNKISLHKPCLEYYWGLLGNLVQEEHFKRRYWRMNSPSKQAVRYFPNHLYWPSWFGLQILLVPFASTLVLFIWSLPFRTIRSSQKMPKRKLNSSRGNSTSKDRHTEMIS